jgi:vacuolar iron transporter family protein
MSGDAGGTGAVAAAVSMMAGTFLDVESTNDQAAARVADARARYEADPGLQDSDVHRRLVTAGLSDTEAATVAGIVGKHPETSFKLAAGLDLGTDQPARQNPVVQSVWMFFTDLFAAAVPVVPFALFTLAGARVVSLSVTLVLLVLLGVGRSMIGRRRVPPGGTVTEACLHRERAGRTASGRDCAWSSTERSPAGLTRMAGDGPRCCRSRSRRPGR